MTARVGPKDLALLDRALGSVRVLAPSATFDLQALPAGDARADASLLLQAPRLGEPRRFLVEVKRTHLTYELAEALVARFRRIGAPWLLCAPYIAPKMASFLVERGAGFVDATGNCHITVDGDVFLHHVETRRTTSEGPAPAAVRAPGYSVILALLTEPELLGATVREIERRASATKSTVSNQLRRLEAEGVLGRSGGQLQLVRPRDLLDKFVAGYADVLRPRLHVGRYATPWREPALLEAQIEQIWSPEATRRWWWGGASAGWRLTRHYHAPTTTVHVEGLPSNVLVDLRALPSRSGGLEILELPNEAARPAQGSLVHPVLVYAEMMASADERTREAAAELRQEHLGRFA